LAGGRDARRTDAGTAAPQSARRLSLHRRFIILDQLVENSIGHFDQFGIDFAIAGDGLSQRHGDDLVSAQGSHVSPLLAMHHVDGAQSIAGGKNAIERTGRSAALNVAEHDRAGFKAGALLNFARQQVPDPTQAFMAELILAEILQYQRTLRSGGELGPFGGHYDAEVSAASMPLANELRNLFDIERNFRNENHIRATGDAAVDRNPARVPAHDLDYDHAIMSLGRRVHAINRAGCDVNRRIKAEGEVGAGQVIVDGLGHAHHLHAVLKKLLRDRESIVATNRDQAIAAILLQIL